MVVTICTLIRPGLLSLQTCNSVACLKQPDFCLPGIILDKTKKNVSLFPVSIRKAVVNNTYFIGNGNYVNRNLELVAILHTQAVIWLDYCSGFSHLHDLMPDIRGMHRFQF